jgi:hypothetical protein
MAAADRSCFSGACSRRRTSSSRPTRAPAAAAMSRDGRHVLP